MIDWQFSFGWLLLGLLIAGAGTAMVVFYKQIADNIAGGINSYDKVKLYGLITIGVGLMIMMNLHTLILGWFVSLFIRK